MRIEGIAADPNDKVNASGTVVNDGEWIYIWSSASKSGLKYRLTDLEVITKEFQQGTNNTTQVDDWKDPEKWATDLKEKESMNCQPEVIPDSQFIPPAEKNFEDMAVMMKSVQQYMQNKPSDLKNLPATFIDPNDKPLPDDNPAGSVEE